MEDRQGQIGLYDEAETRISDRKTPELVLGFVSPIGAGSSLVATIISDKLENDYAYSINKIKISGLITSSIGVIAGELNDEVGTTEVPDDIADRIRFLQVAGNMLRKKYSYDYKYPYDYLAKLAIQTIVKNRRVDGFVDEDFLTPKARRITHIVDSLKHPDEVKLLRNVYGNSFILVGIFSPLFLKHNRLEAKKILNIEKRNALIDFDINEEEDYGQKVSDTFFQSDYFIRNDKTDMEELKLKIDRLLEIVFGMNTQTPTVDESAMLNAFSAAAKSSCLSKQVGASIYSGDNELLGVGWNDVPTKGGGIYLEGCKNDCRCFAWNEKVNLSGKIYECRNDFHKDKIKKNIEDEIDARFKEFEVSTLPSELLNKIADEKELLKKNLRKSGIGSLTEFSRAVHAEMEAILSIARKGKNGIIGATIYTTTYPCHGCARHIVAAGISRVYYIEPYPKSLATELHEDSISEKEEDSDKKVLFLQYDGISPNSHLKFFANSEGKKKDGRRVEKDKLKAFPILQNSLDGFTTIEKLVVRELGESEI